MAQYARLGAAAPGQVGEKAINDTSTMFIADGAWFDLLSLVINCVSGAQH